METFIVEALLQLLLRDLRVLNDATCESSIGRTCLFSADIRGMRRLEGWKDWKVLKINYIAANSLGCDRFPAIRGINDTIYKFQQ
jgi:hypothetical protein